ncbi:MAG TPA: VOC family protein [Jatrophihabitantaceae bacterium]|jgi:catechol-2,3-dioxygenase|nr:VOC family protein [Jatrophihabitantaceae bacterium]
MPINRLNHAVLYVRDVQRSVSFYCDVLDFTPIAEMASLCGAAFLRAPGSTNDHDLGLFEVGPAAADSPAGRGSVGMYHLAWEVDTLEDLSALAQRLGDVGALTGASDHSTTKSLYAHDPDGLEFEIAWIVPADRLDATARAGRAAVQPLDLEREMARYGARTPGGTGVSRPT